MLEDVSEGVVDVDCLTTSVAWSPFLTGIDLSLGRDAAATRRSARLHGDASLGSFAPRASGWRCVQTDWLFAKLRTDSDLTDPLGRSEDLCADLCAALRYLLFRGSDDPQGRGAAVSPRPRGWFGRQRAQLRGR